MVYSVHGFQVLVWSAKNTIQVRVASICLWFGKMNDRLVTLEISTKVSILEQMACGIGNSVGGVSVAIYTACRTVPPSVRQCGHHRNEDLVNPKSGNRC